MLRTWRSKFLVIAMSVFVGYFCSKRSPPKFSELTSPAEAEIPSALGFRLQSVRTPRLAAERASSPEAGTGGVLLRDGLQKLSTESTTAALAYARSQPEPARSQAIIRIFESVANDRTLAVALGRQLLMEEPTQADADGTAVIGVLVRAGSFDAALDLAADGPAASRAEWLSVVLPAMAGDQPQVAAEIALSLIQQGVGGSIFDHVMRNWADARPASAADFALSLPPSEARAKALGTAVDAWLKLDPIAVVNWLPSLHEPREWDTVLAALVTHTDQVVRPPATALAWVDRIADSTLRFSTLQHVVHEWAGEDRAAVRAYLQRSTAGITTDQHDQLVALLNSPSTGEQDSSL